MKSKIEFKEREAGGKVEITLSDGKMYRITFEDKENVIRVQTIDGGMIILPSVSNEIRISTID
jgi:hypothetical protein